MYFLYNVKVRTRPILINYSKYRCFINYAILYNHVLTCGLCDRKINRCKTCLSKSKFTCSTSADATSHGMVQCACLAYLHWMHAEEICTEALILWNTATKSEAAFSFSRTGAKKSSRYYIYKIFLKITFGPLRGYKKIE